MGLCDRLGDLGLRVYRFFGGWRVRIRGFGAILLSGGLLSLSFIYNNYIL